VRPLAPSPAWTLVTPYCKGHPTWARDKNTKATGFPPPSLAPASLSSPLRAPSRADPSGLGHAATFHSSAQGPPGLETPTSGEYKLLGVVHNFGDSQATSIHRGTRRFQEQKISQEVFATRSRDEKDRGRKNKSEDHKHKPHTKHAPSID
jgi:hypothetical protein